MIKYFATLVFIISHVTLSSLIAAKMKKSNKFYLSMTVVALVVAYLLHILLSQYPSYTLIICTVSLALIVEYIVHSSYVLKEIKSGKDRTVIVLNLLMTLAVLFGVVYKSISLFKSSTNYSGQEASTIISTASHSGEESEIEKDSETSSSDSPSGDETESVVSSFDEFEPSQLVNIIGNKKSSVAIPSMPFFIETPSFYSVYEKLDRDDKSFIGNVSGKEELACKLFKSFGKTEVNLANSKKLIDLYARYKSEIYNRDDLEFLQGFKNLFSEEATINKLFHRSAEFARPDQLTNDTQRKLRDQIYLDLFTTDANLPKSAHKLKCGKRKMDRTSLGAFVV